MEFENVSEDIEWEARRHAVAFGLSDCDAVGCDDEEGGQRLSFQVKTEGLWIECWFELDDEQNVWGLLIDDYGGGPFMEDDMFARLMSFDDEVVCESHLPLSKKNKGDEVVSRLLKAVYLLGHPISAFESKLGLTLSHHEKLELRLSMPREFWPKTWRDEDGE